VERFRSGRIGPGRLGLGRRRCRGAVAGDRIGPPYGILPPLLEALGRLAVKLTHVLGVEPDDLERAVPVQLTQTAADVLDEVLAGARVAVLDDEQLIEGGDVPLLQRLRGVCPR